MIGMNRFFKILLFFLMSFNAVASPKLTAQAWLIADENNNIIEGANMYEVRSIASITKLMTSLVVIDKQLDMNELIDIRLHGLKWTREQLIMLAMVHSDNEAAKILCLSYPGGLNECVDAMNRKALQLHMIDTKFIEPTGLYNENVSTAKDLLKLVSHASNYKLINQASNTGAVKIEVPIKNKVHVAEYRNTNPIVREGPDFLVSKTGYIKKSGGCIVMMLKTVNGIRTVILLGSKNTKTRIPEARILASLN